MHSPVWQERELLLHTCKQYYPVFIFRSCESYSAKTMVFSGTKLDVYMNNTKNRHSKPPPYDPQLPLILERVFEAKWFF